LRPSGYQSFEDFQSIGSDASVQLKIDDTLILVMDALRIIHDETATCRGVRQ
jgi:hypothetical protein